MGNIVIELRKRTSDVHAQIKDHPEYWECASTSDQAIGRLIRTHGDRFGIFIEYEENSKPISNDKIIAYKTIVDKNLYREI